MQNRSVHLVVDAWKEKFVAVGERREIITELDSVEFGICGYAFVKKDESAKP
jgi:hypothetical protein